MKRTTFLSLAVLATLSFESFAATRTRDAAREEVKKVIVSSVEDLQQFGGSDYPAANVALLKAEIEGCGMTFTGTGCLKDDTAFENYGTGRIPDMDNKKGDAYIFFSRFKKKGDTRVLIMAIVANKSDCVLAADGKNCKIDPTTLKPVPLAAFKTGSIFALDKGREERTTYLEDFKNCEADESTCKIRPLLAYDPIRKSALETALIDLEGEDSFFAKDFRRFYHAAVLVNGSKDADADARYRMERAIIDRFDIVKKTSTPVYRQAFLEFVRTGLKDDALTAKVAKSIFTSAVSGSAEQVQAALLLGNLGDSSLAVTDALKKIYLDSKLPKDTRKEAMIAYSKSLMTVAERNRIVSLLSTKDDTLRSIAYSTVLRMDLLEGNIVEINKLLASSLPNVRGNGLAALSRVKSDLAIEALAKYVGDKSVDVAFSAASYLLSAVMSSDTIADKTFISILEKSTIVAKAANPREASVLKQLIPVRLQALDYVFTKLSANRASVMLGVLKASISTKTVLLSAKLEAAGYIAKLKSAQGTIALIDLLADTNAELAKGVASILASVVTEAELDLLAKASINRLSPQARILATGLLGGIDSPKVLPLLIKKSQEKLDAQSALVRKEAATQLGKNPTAASTDALIALLTDEAAVRAEAATSLMAPDRFFTDAQIDVLESHLTSTIVDLPLRVLDILSFANTPKALAAVGEVASLNVADTIKTIAIDKLNVANSFEATTLMLDFLLDSSEVVRVYASTQVALKELTAGQVFQIGKMLESADVMTRLLGVRMLSQLATPEAKAIMTAQLEVEADMVVRAAIMSALTPAVVESTL